LKPLLKEVGGYENNRWKGEEKNPNIVHRCFLMVGLIGSFTILSLCRTAKEIVQFENAYEEEIQGRELENSYIDISKIPENDWGQRTSGQETKSSNIISLKVIETWENKDWDKICRAREPNWEKFGILTAENRHIAETPGVRMSIEKLGTIIPRINDYLGITVEIEHICRGKSGEDVLIVRNIQAFYGGKSLSFSVDTKLPPIGEELEALKVVETELGEAKESGKIKELMELRRKLKIEVEKGALRYRVKIPADMFSELTPSEILEFQIAADIEHNGEASLLKGRTFAYVIDESMKAVKPPPILPSSAYYLGDQHLHSTWSDGQEDIPTLANGARNKGYAYIIITDHSYDIDDDSLGDAKVQPHNSPTWQAIGTQCNANTVGGEFACIRGEEISCHENEEGLNAMHYLAYDIGLCVGSSRPNFPDEWPEWPDFHNHWHNDNTVFDYVEIQQGGFGVVAHPQGPHFSLESRNWGIHGYPWGQYGAQWGVEVWNQGAGKALDIWQWRIDRSDIYGPCYGWGNSDVGSVAQMGGVWTWTYASDIYPSYILQGMRSGNAAFGNGPFIALYVLDVNGAWRPMGSMPLATSPFRMYVYWKSWDTFGPVDNIKILSTNGQVVYSFNPNSFEGGAMFSVEASPGRYPLRLEARTSGGKEGYSNPIWVDVNRVRLKPIADAFTDLRDNPGGNYGSATWIGVNYATKSGVWPSGLSEGTFLKFDLSSIPSNATITGATFGAYAYQIWWSTTCDSHLRAFGTDWSESTITGNNAPWGTLGGAVSNTVRGSIPSWWIYGIDSTYIQGRLGGEVGFYLCYPGTAGSVHYGQLYYSKEFQDPSYHPYLEVTYTLAGTTVRLQPIADAFTDLRDNPGGNYGSESWIGVNQATNPGSWPSGLGEGTFIKFDLSGIPTNATVTRAIFGVYAYSVWYSTTCDAVLRGFGTNWNEYTITGNNAPWGTLGGQVSSVVKGGIPSWWTHNLDVSYVQGKLGSQIGFYYCYPSTAGATHYGQYYYSKEYGDALYRPYLQITYVIGNTIKIYPSDDAFVDSQDNPNGNYGSQTWIAINCAGGDRPESTWLKFDLSSIPSSATVTKAVFRAYAYQIWWGDKRPAALWDVTTNA
jgi:histidinol phosphatase-like PHP family hydrolase